MIPVDCTGSDATVYQYERNGALYAAAKPDFHYRFKTEASRKLHVDNYIAARKGRAASMADRKKASQAPHPLTVGAILHTNWGYDQTNVEYFEVTRIVGPHTVELREIAQERTETGWLCGRTKPTPGKYLSPRYEGDDAGQPIVRRANADGSVKIDDVRRAWVGASESYWSAYA